MIVTNHPLVLDYKKHHAPINHQEPPDLSRYDTQHQSNLDANIASMCGYDGKPTVRHIRNAFFLNLPSVWDDRASQHGCRGVMGRESGAGLLSAQGFLFRNSTPWKSTTPNCKQRIQRQPLFWLSVCLGYPMMLPRGGFANEYRETDSWKMNNAEDG